MAHVNILKQVKVGDHWSLVAIPRKQNGNYDWESMPEGRYFVEYYERGKRKREAGGGTAAEVQEVARRRKHTLEGQALGLFKQDEEEAKRTTVHVALKKYLEAVEALKKPNTLPKIPGGARTLRGVSSTEQRSFGRSHGMISSISWCG